MSSKEIYAAQGEASAALREMAVNGCSNRRLGVNGRCFNLFLITLVVASLSYYFYLPYFLGQVSFEHFDSALTSETQQTSGHHDDYCSNQELNEWIELGDSFFFKKTAAFYFVDMQLIRMYLLLKETQTFGNFKFHLAIQTDQGPRLSHVIDSTSLGDIYFFAKYGSTNLDGFFDIFAFLNKTQLDIGKVQMSLTVSNSLVDLPMSQPLHIDVKYVKNRAAAFGSQPFERKRNSSLRLALCDSCIHLPEKSHKDLRWWFEANRMIGYDQVIICNQSIANSDNMDRVFRDYQDLVQINRLHCLPNFITNSSRVKYSRRFTDLTINGSSHAKIPIIFNYIYQNECYLKNIDKYDYITVHDVDELIIPHVSEKAPTVSRNMQLVSELDMESTAAAAQLFEDKCNRFAEFNDASYLSSYLKHMVRSKNLNQTSMLFYQAQFLKTQIFENIFDQLDRFLSTLNIKNELESSRFINHSVLIVDPFPAVENEHEPYNHTITIQNRSELVYAVNLVKLYKIHIRSFLGKALQNISSVQYDRVFMYLFDRKPKGKSIHNTNLTFRVQAHYMQAFLNATDKRLPNNAPIYQIHVIARLGPGPQGLQYGVQEDEGYTSHFRFDLKKKPESIRISQLYLDLNYFNCFVKPIIHKLKNV